jgi:hypothetical protein
MLMILFLISLGSKRGLEVCTGGEYVLRDGCGVWLGEPAYPSEWVGVGSQCPCLEVQGGVEHEVHGKEEQKKV